MLFGSAFGADLRFGARVLLGAAGFGGTSRRVANWLGQV